MATRTSSVLRDRRAATCPLAGVELDDSSPAQAASSTVVVTVSMNVRCMTHWLPHMPREFPVAATTPDGTPHRLLATHRA